MNVKRPRRIHEEDEDDLMEFQEEFLRQQQKPAVKLIKKENKDKNQDEIKNKQIKFNYDLENERNEPSINVLSDTITEKTPDLNQINNLNDKFMPKIEKLSKKEIEEFDKQKVKKKSLFAQKLEKDGKLKKFHELNLTNEEAKSENLFSKSRIITGDGLTGPQDAERIHQENIEKLSKMSKEEILTEKKKLLDTLDPKIIAFIKKRSNKSTTSSNNDSDENQIQNTKVENKNLDDLPFKPNKKWLHMNKIEYDKLEWMKNTTAPNITSNDENFIKARFDFNGDLIKPEDNDKIPTTLALHHHGSEPEKAGYSIDELFHLLRSQFNQQRFIAIKCLANIIEKCHLGEYVSQLKEPMLLDQLIESGLLFLLRCSLDNQIESIITITLKSLSNLLQPPRQEEYLDKLFNSFFNSYQLSSLYPFTKLDHDEIKQLNDLEYIKLDTIKALFRMNLIERFVYLIDYFRLNTTNSIEFIFNILIRIARHSAESCYELHEKHQNLIKTTIKSFIPLNWNLNEEERSVDENRMDYSEESGNNSTNVYNRPYKCTIKFIRILSQSSRSIAMCLYKNYDFKSIIIRYLTLDIERYLEIKIEIINLLKIFTLFELADDCLTDGYELLLKEFTFLISNTDTSNRSLLEAYLSLFNSLIVKLNKSNYLFNNKLCLNVLDLVIKHLKVTNININNLDNLNTISLCLNYLMHYLQLTNTTTETNFKRFDLCNSIFKNEILNLNDFITNDVVLNQLTKYLVELSFLLNRSEISLVKYNNLSYLPTYSIPSSANNLFILVFNFFISLLGLLVQTFNFKCENLTQKLNLCKNLISNSYVKTYLKKGFYVQTSSDNFVDDIENNSCYLVKYENYFVYFCIKLILNVYNYQDITTINEDDLYFYHIISLNLIKKFKNGDEFYIHDLITNSIFNLNLWSHLNNQNENENKSNLIKKFQHLNLTQENTPKHQQKCLQTASGNIINSLKTDNDIKNLEQNLYQNLNFLKLNYLNIFFNSNENSKFNFEKSCQLNNIRKSDIGLETLFTSRYKEICLFNTDWIYIPIMTVIQQNQKLKQQQQNIDNIKAEEENVKNSQIILDTLKFIYLCELCRTDYIKQIPITIRIFNLLNVYLTSTSIYLDKNITFYLYLLLIHYVNTNNIEKLSFDTKIPGIISFYDYYNNLLKIFDAESFGDSLFAHYILIPIQQYCPFNLRKLLWSEYLHLFKFIRFDLNKEFLFSIENYLQPCETDFSLIQLYAQALLNDYNYNLIKNSSFAYIIAIKHVNTYLYDHLLLMSNENEINFKKYLFKQFYNNQNEAMKKDLLYYKSVSKENQIQLYDNLPEIRQKWLEKMLE